MTYFDWFRSVVLRTGMAWFALLTAACHSPTSVPSFLLDFPWAPCSFSLPLDFISGLGFVASPLAIQPIPNLGSHPLALQHICMNALSVLTASIRTAVITLRALATSLEVAADRAERHPRDIEDPSPGPSNDLDWDRISSVASESAPHPGDQPGTIYKGYDEVARSLTGLPLLLLSFVAVSHAQISSSEIVFREPGKLDCGPKPCWQEIFLSLARLQRFQWCEPRVCVSQWPSPVQQSTTRSCQDLRPRACAILSHQPVKPRPIAWWQEFLSLPCCGRTKLIWMSELWPLDQGPLFSMSCSFQSSMLEIQSSRQRRFVQFQFFQGRSSASSIDSECPAGVHGSCRSACGGGQYDRSRQQLHSPHGFREASPDTKSHESAPVHAFHWAPAWTSPQLPQRTKWGDDGVSRSNSPEAVRATQGSDVSCSSHLIQDGLHELGGGSSSSATLSLKSSAKREKWLRMLAVAWSSRKRFLKTYQVFKGKEVLEELKETLASSCGFWEIWWLLDIRWRPRSF